MTATQFRKLALELPEAVESSHHDHLDFRVAGKVFASLGPEGDWAMIKLSPREQATLTASEPGGFVPFPGAWGKRGCTKIILKNASAASVRPALLLAWKTTAPRKLLESL